MNPQAFFDGKDAYSDDKNLSDNPHAEGTAEHADWKRGWISAEKNDPFAPHNLED